MIPLQAMRFVAPDSWGSLIVIITVAALCLLMSAFVSGSEIAYFGLTPAEVDDLEERTDRPSRLASAMLAASDRLLATILIANNLVNITMVVLLSFAISRTVIFSSEAVSFVVQTVCLAFLLLLFGEILPKLAANGIKVRWVLAAAPALHALYRLFGPLARLMVRSTGLVGRMVTRREQTVTTDDLETALEMSEATSGQEKQMLKEILTFGEKEASEIMIPRVDVTGIEYHSSWPDARRIMVESGYSRIPVYDHDRDTIRGILYAKDMLPHIGVEDPAFRWQDHLRKPYFVPESRMIDDLLEDFRRRRIHIAVVVDEYGSVRGIVTLEDVIEEIIGDIDDEYDDATRRGYRRIAPDTWIFEGRTTIADFCRATGVDEEAFARFDDVETIAGLVLAAKEDFPAVGEEVSVGPVRLRVLRLEHHRILSLRATLS